MSTERQGVLKKGGGRDAEGAMEVQGTQCRNPKRAPTLMDRFNLLRIALGQCPHFKSILDKLSILSILYLISCIIYPNFKSIWNNF